MPQEDKMKWMPLYVYKYITDIAGMRNEEVGAYTRLLVYQWINGVLPKEIDRLASCAHESPEKFNQIWMHIKSKFSPFKEGLANLHLENVRMEQDKKNSRSKSKAKEAAAARWGSLVFPYDSSEFKRAWEVWKKYKKETYNFKYKTVESEQAALTKLSELSKGNEHMACAIILQSIENQWQGLFPYKQNGNKQGNTNITKEGVIAAINSRYN